MDFHAVTAFSYGSATTLSFILTIYLAFAGWRSAWQLPLAGAALLQTLWLFVFTVQLTQNTTSTEWTLSLEGLYLLAWILALSYTLRKLRREEWPFKLTLTPLVSLLVYLFCLADIWLGLTHGRSTIALSFVLLSIIALTSLEQLIRNTLSSRFLKLLGVSLGIVFIFNVVLYAQNLLFKEIELVLWQARAALLMASSFLVVGAGLLFRNADTHNGSLGFSRPVAFYTTSLLLSSFGIILFALGGYYVQSWGGLWGIYLLTLLKFGFIVILAALFLSNRMRTRMQVWISKHFFNHKYDYRREWLNVIYALTDVTDASELYRIAYQSIGRPFQATNGEVRVLRGQRYQRVFVTPEWAAESVHAVGIDDAFTTVMADHEWVFAPRAKEGPLAEYNSLLPHWVTRHNDIQLIVPLIAHHQLIGFVMLGKPGIDTDLTWEDLDILKTMGRQLANHILTMSQKEQLTEARQLDTYNKLSAFIMHDLNNVAAQLTLVSNNAPRHRAKAAFIDDMIMTVTNAATRMQRLIQKFSRIEDAGRSCFSIGAALASSIDACDPNPPHPVLHLRGADRDIQADRDRFILAFKHLVKNAQEATPATGLVDIYLDTTSPTSTVITVQDTGCGMNDVFVQQRLFKPFETTKKGQGMGIGVYLTRSFIEELGGSLDVTSTPGQGTSFIARLPHVMEQGN